MGLHPPPGCYPPPLSYPQHPFGGAYGPPLLALPPPPGPPSVGPPPSAGARRSPEPRRRNRKRKRGGGSPGARRSPSPERECTLTPEEVLPKLAEHAQSQEGSRFLQKRLEHGGADEAERIRIHEAALPVTVTLSDDAFGNFVVQKLFETGTEQQRTALAGQLTGSIFSLATHRYGCRVIQKMVQLMPDGAHITSELAPRVLECIQNMHANHVIQSCVTCLQPSALGFVIEALQESAETMAGHMYGCRVIQRLLERCCPTEHLRGLLGRVLTGTQRLAQDNHGNYVIQCILERGRKEDKRQVLETIRRDVVEFAKNKVSSNVVEKCFEVSTKGPDAEFLCEEREALFRSILGNEDDPNSPLRQLMHDKFGNYAVQCVIRHSRPGAEQKMLQERILALEAELRSSDTGSHILTTLQNEIGKSVGDNGDQGSAPQQLSKGSDLHDSRQCKPCAWFWKPQGCQNGRHCQHCHVCPEGELKERKKAKRGRGGGRDGSPRRAIGNGAPPKDTLVTATPASAGPPPPPPALAPLAMVHQPWQVPPPHLP